MAGREATGSGRLSAQELAAATPATPNRGGEGLGERDISLRIGLASPEDVDDEVVAWLRRAYQASA